MQAIQTARMEKQLTQKDLAQKTNEKPSVIQDYESGKAIPNPQILGKFERILGVKLRGESRSPFRGFNNNLNVLIGADIGKKLEGPKKS